MFGNVCMTRYRDSYCSNSVELTWVKHCETIVKDKRPGKLDRKVVSFPFLCSTAFYSWDIKVVE